MRLPKARGDINSVAFSKCQSLRLRHDRTPLPFLDFTTKWVSHLARKVKNGHFNHFQGSSTLPRGDQRLPGVTENPLLEGTPCGTVPHGPPIHPPPRAAPLMSTICRCVLGNLLTIGVSEKHVEYRSVTEHFAYCK